MIRTVAVVGNKVIRLLMLSPPPIEGATTEGSSKRIFFAHTVIAPHAIAESLHGLLGREHRAAHHPVDNPTELCARYRARRKDMVRQDLHRKNRILMGKLVHTHGLGGGLLTLGELLSKGM